MADHGEVEYASATGNDYAEHEAMYLRFLALAKYAGERRSGQFIE